MKFKFNSIIVFLFITLNTCQLLGQSLPIPGIVSPVNSAISQEPNVLLDWSASSGQTAYQYRIGLSNNLISSQILQVTSSQANTSNLQFGTVYYWQVRAVKTTAPLDSSSWSTVWSFTTINQLSLVAPVNQATNQAPNEIIDWSALSGLTFYDYQWDTTANFNSPLMVINSVSSGTSQASTGNLRFGTTYYWRARGRHSADTMQWSAIRSFTTIDQLSLVAPVNQATNQAPNEIIDWSALSGLTFYDYQWDTIANFNSPLMVINSVSSGTSQASTGNLRFGTTYYWRARGRHSADTMQWSAIRSFTTIDQLSLVAPVNLATNQAPNEIIDWSALSGLTFYDYQWDTTANFNSPLLTFSSISSGSSQVTTSELRFGTRYFWRARGRHSADTMQWSAIRSFTTIDQLSLVAPVNQATNQAPNEIIDWSALSGLTFYDYQWDTTANFNSPLLTFSSISSGSSQVTTSELRFGTRYFWRARGRHSADTMQWSAIRSFTTIDQISLVSPVNAATNVTTNPVLDWSALSGINTYQYQIDTVITFTNPTSGIIGSGSSQATVSGLINQRIYYWRVRAWHNADTTSWSIVRYFGVGVNSIVAPIFAQVGTYCSGESIPALPTTSSNGISGIWSPAINNSATTTYFFTPNSGQSAAATSLTININQPSTAVDVKSACISYEWIDGITYTQSTNSPTFTLTNSTGCDSVVILNLTISPLEIGIQPVSESVVENSEVIFSVSSSTSGATYQWQVNTGNGFQNITNGGQFSGANTSDLTVSSITQLNDSQQFRCIVSTSTCSLVSDIAILTVENIVGIEVQNYELKIYPNPTTQDATLHVKQQWIGKSYQLFNSTGALIHSGTIQFNLETLNLNDLPTGFYFLCVDRILNQSIKIVKL